MANTQKEFKSCYNSFSCILSVMIIAFVIGSIIWDIMVTKPEMKQSIEEIKIEVQNINKKIDNQYSTKNIFEAIEKSVNDSIQ